MHAGFSNFTILNLAKTYKGSLRSYKYILKTAETYVVSLGKSPSARRLAEIHEFQSIIFSTIIVNQTPKPIIIILYNAKCLPSGHTNNTFS